MPVPFGSILLPVITGSVATGSVVYLIGESLSRRKTDLRERLDHITGVYDQNELGKSDAFNASPDLAYAAPTVGGFDPTVPAAARPDMVPLLTRVLSASEISKTLRNELVRGGLKIRPSEFVALILFSLLGMFFIGYVLSGQLMMGVLLALAGVMVPIMLLKQRQSARKAKFNVQLPDVLALVASSLRTGYSFLHSTQLVVEEMAPPMSEEFAWVMGEATLGVPMDVALQRLVERVGSYDLDLVVTAILIQLQVGGNLAEILDTIAETIRERARIKNEISALTAEGKLSGIILFLMPLFLGAFLWFRQPGYFDPLIKDPMGIPIIIATITAQILGGLIIMKMVNIDV